MYEIYQDVSGDYRWRLKSKNGRIVAESGEGFRTRKYARKSIDRLKESWVHPKITVLK